MEKLISSKENQPTSKSAKKQTKKTNPELTIVESVALKKCTFRDFESKLSAANTDFPVIFKSPSNRAVFTVSNFYFYCPFDLWVSVKRASTNKKKSIY